MSQKMWGILCGLTVALALSSVPARAGIDLNEVGAFLVYQGVRASLDDGGVESFLTITNTSANSIIAHVAFINGNAGDPKYCYECDFDVPMTGLDTETLVLTTVLNTTQIVNLDTGAIRSCAQSIGFVTVDVEDASHNVLTDNILLGSEVVVNYGSGAALSVSALSIQGENGDGDRFFGFDGVEYRQFPSVLGADFIAPNIDQSLRAALVLFTLAFDRQFPPLTDCSVIGFDAFENQFSSSMQFGCWTVEPLEEIDPEFAYPYLGLNTELNDHGWLQLSCTVYGTGSKNGVVQGGVHGAIVQDIAGGTRIRRNPADPGPQILDAAAWARLLYQSSTVGDSMYLHLENAAHGGTF